MKNYNLLKPNPSSSGASIYAAFWVLAFYFHHPIAIVSKAPSMVAETNQRYRPRVRGYAAADEKNKIKRSANIPVWFEFFATLLQSVKIKKSINPTVMHVV